MYKRQIRDLGTLGGGNHFAEFQCVERIYDQEAAGSLGLCADRILLLVHCGSRGYGQEILSRFWVPEGLADGSEQAEAYMACLLYTSTYIIAEGRVMYSYHIPHERGLEIKSHIDACGLDGALEASDGIHIHRSQSPIPRVEQMKASLRRSDCLSEYDWEDDCYDYDKFYLDVYKRQVYARLDDTGRHQLVTDLPVKPISLYDLSADDYGRLAETVSREVAV